MDLESKKTTYLLNNISQKTTYLRTLHFSENYIPKKNAYKTKLYVGYFYVKVVLF